MEHNIQIIPFEENLACHFKALNTAWIIKYFETEIIDQEMLNHPKKYFIDKGGYIFFAKLDDKIVGTFALLKESNNVYELCKMAVDEKFQGKKIGNRMMALCIEKAKELGAVRLILYSNKKLQPAIHLYKKYGFTEIPMTCPAYDRCNIKMQLPLK